MKKMKKQLVQLLNIQAPSGQEHKVVRYVKPVLKRLCEKVWLDNYGNLLAEKTVGDGKGATIILSAHMDSVNRLDKDRKVIEENGTFYSTKGVLGADDRAGIAIILAVLRNIDKTGFEGKIKVAFSREEEIGCIGSGKIDEEWIKGSDLAIVVDRRGNKDIVVGNFAGAFCSTEVGKFFEDCSALQDMDWEACEGGISDACTFSELGVHSVNLSAGYMNEHTAEEYVVFNDMKKTVNLILQVLALVNDFAHTFGEVPQTNQWISGNVYVESFNDGFWYDDEYIHLWDGRETNGSVTASIINGDVCITQKSGNAYDELFITKSTFEKIIRAYEREKYREPVSVIEDDLPFDSYAEVERAREEEIEREFLKKHGKAHLNSAK